jgi:uncharacterized membrane protein
MNPVARVVSTVALAATAFFTLTAFQTLPADAQLAIHWNIDGAADGFAGREALLLLPAIFGLTALLTALAIRFDPKRDNIVRSAEALGYVVMGLVLLFAVTQSAIINSGYGEAARLDHAVPVVLGALFVLLGYAAPQIKQNYTIGVRLPWTLESVAAWDAAHITVGRAWIVTGAVTALLGVIPTDIVDLGAAPLLVFFVGLAASLVATTYVAYSTFSAGKRPGKRPRRKR